MRDAIFWTAGGLIACMNMAVSHDIWAVVFGIIVSGAFIQWRKR